MSRIGKKPVALPAGVDLSVQAGRVKVKGPKGALEIDLPPGIGVDVESGAARVRRSADTRPQRSLHGLARALVQNMVTGVTEGFERRLTIVGVGYSARVEGRKLVINIGFCHPVEMEIPEAVEVEVPARTNTIILRGPDKATLGQFAANIRAVRPPEPYKGKGIRYEDEKVRRKAGKSVVGGGK